MQNCTPETSGFVISIIENKTAYNVSLTYYRYGKVQDDQTITLIPNETKTVLDTSPSDNRITYPHLIQTREFDSLTVSFNTRMAVHYNKRTVGSNPKAIGFDNNRNVFNENNWIEKIFRNSKNHFEAEYQYYITEEDYLNAE